MIFNTRKVLFYDTTAKGLSFLWKIGGTGQQFLNNFDYVVPVTSWSDVYNWLEENKYLPLGQIQFWMHGYSGRPVIDDRGPILETFKRTLNDRRPDIWFRACDVFSRAQGRAFAYKWATDLNCYVTGHTRVISWPIIICQSGGFTIAPNQIPHWAVDEGVNTDGTSKGSSWLAPNTCSIFRMSPPELWEKQP